MLSTRGSSGATSSGSPSGHPRWAICSTAWTTPVSACPGEWFDVAVDWSVAAIEGGGTVLTHCHMGVNRGPSLGFAVLLEQGWDPIEALDAIRTARPIAWVAYAEDALRWHHERGRGERAGT